MEPCALLLEFARKAMQSEQQPILELSMDDEAMIVSALQRALKHPVAEVREADFNAPDNPRRFRLV